MKTALDQAREIPPFGQIPIASKSELRRAKKHGKYVVQNDGEYEVTSYVYEDKIYIADVKMVAA